jgi:hypothetical protein
MLLLTIGYGAAALAGQDEDGTLSLFYWSVGNDQITRGVSPGDFTILIAVGLCALAASVAAPRNADLN